MSDRVYRIVCPECSASVPYGGCKGHAPPADFHGTAGPFADDAQLLDDIALGLYGGGFYQARERIFDLARRLRAARPL